ncbi:MAG: WcaF family extracellular polysaccharide biosynthesis acetyltransferase [Bacteroidota bacterium]
MSKVDLSIYDNSDFHVGASRWRVISWFLVQAVLFKNPLIVSYSFKRFLLRSFGAKVGEGVIIKPGVRVKYPWLLEVGAHSWVGEGVWIDNLVPVKLGESVCLSQGAMLLTGNHNYSKASFDLITGSIELEDGVWIGAKAVVCPGVHAETHAVLAVGSVASENLEAYQIYRGNPAKKVRERVMLALD